MQNFYKMPNVQSDETEQKYKENISRQCCEKLSFF